MQLPKSNLAKIPKAIWIIGFVTLLMNLSSIMIFSLTPLYITQVFGLAAFHLGLLEGGVEFCSWITRIFSGVISDFLKKRKPILIFAYACTFLSRPVFALASNVWWVYAAKLTDRISNGIQATPREALVGDIAPKGTKGTCYGLRQSLGLLGSLLGATGIVYLMRATNNNYEFIFWIAAIPPLLALVAMTFFVKDPVQTPSIKQEENQNSFSLLGQIKKIPHLGKAFWCITLVSGVFMTSNYSGAYRILQAERIGFPLTDISIIMVIQNLAALLSAFPTGRLSDRIDRRILLAIGFCITILSNISLGFIEGIPGIIIGSALWGMQMGITQSVFLALVADASDRSLRGTAFGMYYFVTAIALFTANCSMGWLFDLYGPTLAFVFSGATAAIGLPLLLLIKPTQKTITAS